MGSWLLKSEPDAFSWEEQVERGVEPWTGVRNHQARASLQAMRVGERAFFYHSNVGRAVVGVVEVVREAYPDPTAQEGAWACVDVRAVGAMPRAVTLAAMKGEPGLARMALLRQSRLSVCPVTEAEWDVVCEMGGWTG